MCCKFYHSNVSHTPDSFRIVRISAFFDREIGFVPASPEATQLQFGFVLPVEMAIFQIAQINMIEKWNFLNFKKWGEISVFFVSSLGDVRFWSINRCRLAAWVVWVKRVRKKRRKSGAKARTSLQKFDKSVQKSALLCKKYAEI